MTYLMKILRAAALAAAVFAGMPAHSQDIKIGIILGFTGPIETLTPGMAASAELALKEASNSGYLLGGRKAAPVRADSTCVDNGAATAAAERLVTVERVAAIMGADCSGVTTAIANNVAVPNGVVMVSPSATSPALSSIDDNGFFHRTAPSDARQGQVLAAVLRDRGIRNVAVTYTNNDYGKGLSESFINAFTKGGGKIAIKAAHEDGKADYSAEVAALSAAGAKHLAVFGYVDQGGKGIIQASIDSDAFSRFILADGMIGKSLIEAIGDDLNGTIGTLPGGADSSAAQFIDYASANGVDGDGPFRAESYDAAALLMLAIQAAGTADRAAIRAQMMRVTNAPGVKIAVGQIGKALKILAGGGDVDYVGATNVEFNQVGEVFGTYKELEVKRGEFKTVQVR
ncbi:MAG: ABC transporter substrate-binding protein [Gammaproteobacteria bacterium]